MFADDAALVAHSVKDLQAITTAFATAAENFSLKINIKN